MELEADGTVRPLGVGPYADLRLSPGRWEVQDDGGACAVLWGLCGPEGIALGYTRQSPSGDGACVSESLLATNPCPLRLVPR